AHLGAVLAASGVGPGDRGGRYDELVGARHDRLAVVRAGEVRPVAQVPGALGERQPHARMVAGRAGEADPRVPGDHLAELADDVRYRRVVRYHRRPHLVDAAELARRRLLVAGDRDLHLARGDRPRERYRPLHLRVA